MSTTDKSKAQQVAALLGDDGMNLETKDGKSLRDLVTENDGWLEASGSDVFRFEFPDGGAIVQAGSAWDFARFTANELRAMTREGLIDFAKQEQESLLLTDLTDEDEGYAKGAEKRALEAARFAWAL